MKRIEPYLYYLGVYKCEDISNLSKIDSIILAVEAPAKYIFSMRQLIALAHNYFETLYIRKWIKKPELRFLAFILMETQIDKIVDKVREEDKRMIIISREDMKIIEKCKSVILREKSRKDIPYLKKLAVFRMRLEKEKY